MKQLSYNTVKSVYEKHNYAFPVASDRLILKIAGIRTNNQLPHLFNDYFVCCWEEKGEPKSHVCMGTTHPGAYYMEHPMNPAGSAVIVPGYHADVWKIGMHKRNPLNRCLVQVRDILIWRDNDGGNLLPKVENKKGVWQAWDENGRELKAQKSGMAGLELHGTKPNWANGLSIGKWSAGCQVIESWESKEKIMDLASRHVHDNEQDTFSYALFVEDDFS